MFAKFTTVLGSNVANAGTVTIPYPLGLNQGQITDRPGVDRLWVEGGNPVPRDKYSLSATASGLQITNSTGITWAKGSTVTAEITRNGLYEGVRSKLPGELATAATPIPLEFVSVDFGIPEATSNTYVLNATAVTGSAPIAITPTVASFLWSRVLRFVSSNAGDTTQVITIRGTDVWDLPITQTVTLNGTTAVLTTKAFKTIISLSASAALAGNLSIGITDSLGLSVLWSGTVPEKLEAEFVSGVAAGVAGTLTAGATNYHLPTVGGALGLYTPDSSLTVNGTRRYQLVLRTGNRAFKGVIPQVQS